MVGSVVLSIVLALMSQDATPGSPAASKPEDSKKICRKVTPTGSMLPVRICLTAAEWKQVNDSNKNAMDRGRSGGVGCARDASDTGSAC